MNTAMQKILGEVAPSLRDFSSLLVIAEEEISAVKRRSPAAVRERFEHGQRPSAFAAICPTSLLRDKDHRVYRAHARELLERMVKNEKLEPGTRAEVLCMLLELVLRRPPAAQMAALIDVLFEEIFPGKLEGEKTREPWDGASEELFRQCAKKIATKRGA